MTRKRVIQIVVICCSLGLFAACVINEQRKAKAGERVLAPSSKLKVFDGAVIVGASPETEKEEVVDLSSPQRNSPPSSKPASNVSKP